MREIKFRAWDEMNEIMHFNFQYLTSGDHNNDWICFSSDKKIRDTKSFANGIVFQDPFLRQQLKIMQYTGLKDKNGKEIYEGDIVKRADYEHNIGEVIYFTDKYHACFEVNDAKFTSWSHDNWYANGEIQFSWEGLEVIGNIYENPELLEKEET